jgi:hypothetical protein
MRKLLVTLSLSVSCLCYADAPGMAQDILKQIIHGSVNTNPDLTEVQADQSVVVSLRSAILILACANRNPTESAAQTKCIKEHKNEIVTIGDLSEPSFKVGAQAAQQQSLIHRELTSSAYPQVINDLVMFVNNLSRNDAVNTPLKTNK